VVRLVPQLEEFTQLGFVQTLIGNIIRADVLLDLSGRSKGQGTVLFESSNEAQKAIRTLAKTWEYVRSNASLRRAV